MLAAAAVYPAEVACGPQSVRVYAPDGPVFTAFKIYI